MELELELVLGRLDLFSETDELERRMDFHQTVTAVARASIKGCPLLPFPSCDKDGDEILRQELERAGFSIGKDRYSETREGWH